MLDALSAETCRRLTAAAAAAAAAAAPESPAETPAEAPKPKDAFSAQEIANISWALASLRHYDAPLLAALTRAAAARIAQFSPIELGMLVWGVAHLAHGDAAFLRALTGEVQRRLAAEEAAAGAPPGGVLGGREVPSKFEAANVANIGWGLCVLEHVDPAFFGRFLSFLGRRRRRLDRVVLAQTWQVIQTLHGAAPELIYQLGPAPPPGMGPPVRQVRIGQIGGALHPELFQRATEAWGAAKRRGKPVEILRKNTFFRSNALHFAQLRPGSSSPLSAPRFLGRRRAAWAARTRPAPRA